MIFAVLAHVAPLSEPPRSLPNGPFTLRAAGLTPTPNMVSSQTFSSCFSEWSVRLLFHLVG